MSLMSVCCFIINFNKVLSGGRINAYDSSLVFYINLVEKTFDSKGKVSLQRAARHRTSQSLIRKLYVAGIPCAYCAVYISFAPKRERIKIASTNPFRS